MGRLLALVVSTILSFSACTKYQEERPTVQDAVAFGFGEIECRGLAFGRIYAHPAASEMPERLCDVVALAVDAAVARETVSSTDLHPNSVAAVVVDMRSNHGGPTSGDAGEIGVIFDLVHERWNLIVWIRGDSILDTGGVPKGLRY